MTDLRDVVGRQRFEQGFTDADGQTRTVFADYAIQGDTRIILHVALNGVVREDGARLPVSVGETLLEPLSGHYIA